MESGGLGDLTNGLMEANDIPNPKAVQLLHGRQHHSTLNDQPGDEGNGYDSGPCLAHLDVADGERYQQKAEAVRGGRQNTTTTPVASTDESDNLGTH
jgi:hypothetical protein